ncbi:MAG: RluA family pseudouridine synthase [Bacteroidales bacterium]|nr:RluA family pseudouridine synthase [Bacteroidales bacterium]MDD4672924.1 RluA family pseudouridine synthase [Bacteroidales bacterium]MDY0349589.1 RluA family pseudouridine synthase [Tenuifilaceae bacterium]
MSGIHNRILFEDNHLIAVNKLCGEIVQGDKTGDTCMIQAIRNFIKKRDSKPGNVFLEAVHRIDRPVSGAVLFAKTSKGLSRMSKLFHDGDVEKIYWAVVANVPQKNVETLRHYMVRSREKNKSFAYTQSKPSRKEARLTYKLIGSTGRYYLLQVELHTGRHHQIRAQLAKIGLTVRGDLKYGAPRSNPNGGINLHAYSLLFTHPVSNEPLHILAPPPNDTLWNACAELVV